MKKVFMLFVLTVFTTVLFAKNTKPVDMIETSKETLFVKNIRTTFNRVVVTTFDGEKLKFDKNEVKSYIKDGHQFDRVKMVASDCCIDKNCFMELLAYKNGFKVYKYEFCNSEGEITSRHLVFKNNEFIVKFDDRNKQNLIAFFNS